MPTTFKYVPPQDFNTFLGPWSIEYSAVPKMKLNKRLCYVAEYGKKNNGHLCDMCKKFARIP